MRGRALTLISLFAVAASALPAGGFHGGPVYVYRPAEPAPAAGTAPPAGPSQPVPAPAAQSQPAPAPASAPAQSPSQAPAAPAAPAPSVPAGPSSGSSSGGDFQISIQNNCPTDLSFGIFKVGASFDMSAVGGSTNIAAGGQGSLSAPFTGIGMRLSATADAGVSAQWAAQALFEFGYSEYNGMTGTAYDLSVMGGNTGVAVYPENSQCPSKVCNPGSCAAGQGWTNPGQVNAGSPADTVCYQGKTNFRVVWCP